MSRIKQTSAILLAFFFIVACGGCANTESSSNATLNTVSVSELSNEEDAIVSKVSACQNLNLAMDFQVSVPETSSVYTFTTQLPEKQDFQGRCNSFQTLFQALYPSHIINKDFLFYTGENSLINYDDNGQMIRNYNTVAEKKNELSAGTEDCDGLLYDETWFRDVTEWNEQVCLAEGLTLEYDTILFNKGKTAQISGKSDGVFPCLNYYSPSDYFECVGTYTPDSTEQFRLLDKDMKIADAVEFYETYINALAYENEPTVQTSVAEVDVLKLNADTYGYFFVTTNEYQDIPMDYRLSGSYSSDDGYDYSYSTGIMIESNDVDIAAVPYHTQIIGPNELKSVVSPAAAIKLVSEKLSQQVQFEVQNIQICYTKNPTKTSDGYIDIENPSSSVSPAWKFILYNPNDKLIYVCYVDAVNGENFRYYTTSNY